MHPPASTGISKSVIKHSRFMPLISFLGSSIPDLFCRSIIMMPVHQNCAPHRCACKWNSVRKPRYLGRERVCGARPSAWRKFAGGKTGKSLALQNPPHVGIRAVGCYNPAIVNLETVLPLEFSNRGFHGFSRIEQGHAAFGDCLFIITALSGEIRGLIVFAERITPIPGVPLMKRRDFLLQSTAAAARLPALCDGREHSVSRRRRATLRCQARQPDRCFHLLVLAFRRRTSGQGD